MKLKKIFSVSIIIFTLLLLVGCSNSFERTYDFKNKLPKDFVESNSNVETGFLYNITESVKLNENHNIDALATNQFEIVSKVIEGEEKYGVINLFNNELLLEQTYSLITSEDILYFNKVLDSYFYIRIFYVTDSLGRKGLFNSLENKYMVNFDLYEYINYRVDFLGDKRIEVITTKLPEEDELITKNIIYFDEDYNVDREPLKLFSKGEVISDFIPYFKLRDPRLKAYKYNLVNNILIGYKNEKEVFRTSLEKEPNVVRQFVGKHLIIQTKTKVAFDSRNYDFFDGSDKYLLNTIKVSLTSGKVSKVRNFNYNLSNIMPKLNKNKEETCFIANAEKIVNKTLLDVETLLFNSNLKLVTNLSNIEYSSHIKLDDNLYYSNNRLVNSKFDVLLDLRNYDFVSYIPKTNLISVKYDGNYGLVNFDGIIVAEFVYQEQFDFYNGYSHNINAFTGAKVVISTEGVVKKLDNDKDYFVNHSIIMSEGDNLLTFKNNKLDILLSLEGDYSLISSRTINSFTNFENRGVLIKVRDNSTNKIETYIFK